MVIPFIVEKTLEIVINGAVKNFIRRKRDTTIPYIGQRFSAVKSMFDDTIYYNAVVLDVIESFESLGDEETNFHIIIQWSNHAGELVDIVESDTLDEMIDSGVDIDYDELDIWEYDDTKLLVEHYDENVSVLCFDYHEWYE
jgi:hypothetical protein